ncbi:30S ribosomal protein S17 [candidate division Kazan bacterium RBG_13_50_9]|uniref:Small ribosomal subunit protein uS17 n=1 Tax=candidate division Kazan bacterium RBG_13_50_9 TaxID=1798535 RepID=A0A1F4NUA2_UNCK3|nr:MAG: 30S ribosomal protein S17 [candidate division Kazan bacterium RBG_13_50_9]
MDNQKQRKVGKVVSTQMAATAVVSVDTFISHPIYGKKIRRTRRFLVHDPESKAGLNDIVTIEETRPLSKRKRWVVVDVKKAPELTDAIDDVLGDEEIITGAKSKG